MKIAILGYGSQGKSAYSYWNTHENQITICDSNTDLNLPHDVDSQLGSDYLSNLDKFDLVVRTPILHPRDIIAANSNSPKILKKVTTVTNEFLRVCPTKNIIGVTGTKGKGTTSTLITRILENSGFTVHLGGNIGIPPLNMLEDSIKKDDWVVLELANFQLIDLKISPPIAVCLMVEPEHLDWHEDMAEYIETKQQLFKRQNPKDIAIYYGKNAVSQQIASASAARKKIPYLMSPGAFVENNNVVIDGNIICPTHELKLIGKHNWQNICAAITTTWQITHDISALKQTLLSFSGLPFRLELRRELDGVKYYNDSFASGPPATIAALESIVDKKILLIGGYDRGLELTELVNKIKSYGDNIRKVILYGASAKRVGTEFHLINYDNFEIMSEQTIEPIVRRAQSIATKGDAVLFSPSFASFDMFNNFEDRGEKYNEAVESL
ncbi:MAG: UDP-N-acetylmuramoyl-L-alanine--D-glutamate ligase [Candidatus Saccharimonadales bacterium]